jgi:hypothetical protein
MSRIVVAIALFTVSFSALAYDTSRFRLQTVDIELAPVDGGVVLADDTGSGGGDTGLTCEDQCAQAEAVCNSDVTNAYAECVGDATNQGGVSYGQIVDDVAACTELRWEGADLCAQFGANCQAFCD